MDLAFATVPMLA